MATFLSEYLGVDPKVFDDHGALNISIVNDLPLFIDPFLLFHSEKSVYLKLHDKIIEYLVFLRDQASKGNVSEGQLRNWYCFPEVKQNWLGFSESGNSGAGLGIDFARNLHNNLNVIFSNFGGEQVTESSHLEKVCLVSDGVGRDNISDFTTNLILDFLCNYTQAFCLKNVDRSHLRDVSINRADFDYRTETWKRTTYRLPWVNGDYVLLTPRDILTRDENWINKSDLIQNFESIPSAIPDLQLRAAVSNYFEGEIARHIRNKVANAQTTKRRRSRKPPKPTRQDRSDAAVSTMRRFPQIIDYFIRLKEQTGDEAVDVSKENVLAIEYFFIQQLKTLQALLRTSSNFYLTGMSTYDEAHQRLAYLKDVIENKGGHRFFYDNNGEPIEREKDLHVLYRLVWFGTPSDMGTEANDGRGPVDFKISRGREKTLVEMKLAKNGKLEQNLAKQVEIYQAASDAATAIKAIIYFTREELVRVRAILERLSLGDSKDVVLIDARRDNKPSASKAA